ncbi:MAG: hypothetical protein M0020_09450 [Actinomycetota bacterium]|nr:hypothetical protein [Actinomycetota bacterium]
MGFMDKVKEGAAQVASKAQDAGKAGQAKLEEVQAKRRLDALLRDLGAVVYLDKAGRGSDNAESEAVDLISQIEATEKEHEVQVTPPGA